MYISNLQILIVAILLVSFAPLLAPASTAQESWYISGDNPDGLIFIAPHTGVYRFLILDGAYTAYQPEGWRTQLLIYRNRSVEFGPPFQYNDTVGNIIIDKPLANWDYALGDDALYMTFAEAERAGTGKYVDVPLNESEYVLIIVKDTINIRGYPYGPKTSYYYNYGGIDIRITLQAQSLIMMPPLTPAITYVRQPPGGMSSYSQYEDLYISSRDENGVTIQANETGYYYLFMNNGAYRTLNAMTCPEDKPEWLGWKTAIAVYKNRPIEYNESGVTNWDFLIGSSDNRSTYEEAVLYKPGQTFRPGLSTSLKKNDTLIFVCLDSKNGYADNSGGFTLKTTLLPPIYSIPDNIATPIKVVTTGAGISLIGVLLNSGFKFTFGGSKSYLQRWASVKEVNIFRITARAVKKPVLFNLSLIEILVVIITAILLGIAFLYADQLPFLPANIALFVAIAGVTTIIHEFAHIYYALRYKSNTEFRLWGIGTLSMAMTTLLFGTVFGQPARTIINDLDRLDKGKAAIISLAGPAASFGISGVLLLLAFFGGPYAHIGIKGLPISMATCVYSLLPFEPIEGKKIFNWQWGVWLVIFIPLLILYMGMLLAYEIFI